MIVLRIPNRMHEAYVREARERIGLPINLPPPHWPWQTPQAQEKRP